jgi:C4-dicarboxylate transporter DctQ subunit
VLHPLIWVHDRLTDLGFQLGKLCLGIILFSYSFEVVSRYFFNAPTWWADEAVSYSLCIGCFLMMPHVTREKGHVAVTFLLELMPAQRAKPCYWLIYLLGFLVCGAAFWINLDENIRQFVRDVHLMKVKPIPKYYISVFITFGFGMSALHFLRFLDYRKIEIDQRPAGGESYE